MDGTARVAAGLLVCGLLFCAPAAAGLEETVKKHRDAGAQMVDWIEARVNDDVITHREYEDRVRLAAMELSREPNSELRQAVLRQMVEDLLILQLAQKENIVFPDEQLAAQVDRMVAAAKARFPSEEEFWKYLERSRLSPEAYRADLAETLRRNAIITRMQRRMVEGIVVTASDVEKFKAENPTAAAERDKLRIGLIQLSIPEGATPEQEESVMLKARTLAARLDAGDDFSRLAAEHSTHPSRDSGGDLGDVSRGDVPELDFLFDQQPGYTSPPLRQGGAVRIYRVLDRRGLPDLVRAHKMEQQYKKILDELKASAIIEIRGQRVEFF